MRGRAPYWEYMPHFLYDLFNTENECFIYAVQYWIKDQKLTMFFNNPENLVKENIKDLAGSGSIFKHSSVNIDVDKLLDNYIDILLQRKI